MSLSRSSQGKGLVTAASVQRQQHKTTRNRNNQENVTPPEEYCSLTLTNPRDLPDQEFKIVVGRKLSELQESTERQFNRIKKTVHKGN